jgi:hypothetical protein
MLQLNAQKEITVYGDGVFQFFTSLPDQSSYAVTVSLQPAGQTCLVSNGTGTINYADVTDVVVQCADTENPSQTASVDFATVDDGSALSPTITTITINPASIRKSESQADVIFGEWTKDISAPDYAALQTMIADYDIMSADDVSVPTDQQACEDWGGMTITIEDAVTHQINISGQACDRAQWPAGVRELVSFKDSLEASYFCSNPVTVYGQREPLAPGYIVDFKEGIDPDAETNRLAELYGFTPTHIYQYSAGFAADLAPTILEPMRCETSIQAMYFDGVAYATAPALRR